MRIDIVIACCLQLFIPASYAMLYPSVYSGFDVAFYACNAYISETATLCLPLADYSRNYECWCNTNYGFGTLADCIVKGYKNDSRVVQEYIDNCNSNNVSVTLSLDSFYTNYSTALKDMKNVTTITGFNMTIPYDHPVLLKYGNDMFRSFKRSYRVFLKNFNYGYYFGIGCLVYWAVVLLIAALVNWTIRLCPGFVNFFTGRVSNIYRRHITLSATFKRKKTSEGKWLSFFDHLVPSRMETIIIGIFVFLNIFFCALFLTRVEPNPVFTNVNAQVCTLIADRTGDIVCFHIPLLVLFAGRNNFLQWLTRWNFATFITYHRWISRIAILLVIIHSIAFTIAFCLEGYYTMEMQEDFLRWGTVATVCGGLILLQGMFYFRRKCYEVFLLIHILLALFFIVGGYYHVDIMGFGAMFWAAVAVWAFDRTARFARLIAFGAPVAKISLLAEETLKVIIPKPRYWKSSPGSHAFVHFGKLSCFWQSHPFTFTEVDSDSRDIVLYMKLKGGVTHGLYQHLLKCPERTTNMRVCVEGPYGEASSARVYKNAVFMAGGNGIPGIYSEVCDLAKRDMKQSLKLIWVIREWKSLSWFYDELKHLKDTKVQITIYVTRPAQVGALEYFKAIISDQSSNELEDKEKDLKCENEKEYDLSSSDPSTNLAYIEAIKADLSHVTFMEGRPSIDKIVEDEVTEADGSIAFVTCGHPVMVDDLRYAVIQNLDKCKYRVEFFELLQVWA
ncbi:uncharacterized protein PRCAT00002055001 [Priceomyces carsonii]|uniref:uncharacterized protein n=1 Tax=Priceomyces carsonii TaxID=28549 RepID=UPI002EDA1E6B|nr:unnamed protein product [Priceomyces carsonii]